MTTQTTIAMSCEIAPMIFPPVAKNPINNGGIVQGTSRTTFGQNPTTVKK